MGRKKKFTGVGLRKAVDAYFDSISRSRVLTERVPTDQKDEYGHVIYEEREILNKAGEPITVTEYLVPPTEGGLCLALGIHRSTWNNYGNEEEYPEFFDTVSRARGRLHTYLEEQALIRKEVRGVTFLLEMEERRRIEAAEAREGADRRGLEIAFVDMEEDSE